MLSGMKLPASNSTENPRVTALSNRYQELANSTKFMVAQGDSFEWSQAPLPEVETISFARRLSLASDPAHGGKVSNSSVEEGAVGLLAETSGLVHGFEREGTGKSEFVDSSGQMWDVKSPISPMPSQKWVFNANHQLDLVRKEISGGENVLLNLSRCNEQDSGSVLSLITENLAPWEKQRVVVLMPKTND